MSCVDSLYIWQGALESSSEVKVVMKTLEKHFEIITQEIKRLGSYEVPCVLGTYVDIANSEYSEWIAQSIAVFKNT
jgi:periplasmic divalent cation tolerance protein